MYITVSFDLRLFLQNDVINECNPELIFVIKMPDAERNFVPSLQNAYILSP